METSQVTSEDKINRLLQDLQDSMAYKRESAINDVMKSKLNDLRIIKALEILASTDSNESIRKISREAIDLIKSISPVAGEPSIKAPLVQNENECPACGDYPGRPWVRVIKYTCPFCGRKIQERENEFSPGKGVQIICPNCGRITHIPASVWCPVCGKGLQENDKILEVMAQENHVDIKDLQKEGAEPPTSQAEMDRILKRLDSLSLFGTPGKTPSQPAATRPASRVTKPVTQNQPAPKPAQASQKPAVVTASPTPFPFPKNFKTVTILSSAFGPGLFTTLLVFIIAGLSGSSFGSPLLSILMFLLMTFLISALNFLYYMLAGGLEWRNKKLPMIRIVLFYILGDVVIGLFFYAQWYLVRVIMAKAYDIPFPLAMGRLLATQKKYNYTSITETGNGEVCEKCGKRTSIGKFYSFVCGEKIRSYTSAASYNSRTITTEYKTHESASVYLCNKCVILKNQREAAKTLRTITFVVLAALVFVVVLYFALGIMNEFNFLGWPIGLIILLIIVGSVTLIQWMRLAGREETPVQYFSDNRDSILLNRGEALAIRLKKRSLAKAGVDAFFTHAEAQARLHRIRRF